ncbi:MAG: tRNA 2-thiouridine(34) synthase MnmA, partial [Clostridia bacterium]|nr:tRNA 2-thiouridine(34) synthase MnmA [Clostridia bacterium]
GKDLKRNLLIVQQGEHEELYSTDLLSDRVNWITGEAPATVFRCTAKFRYRQPDQEVSVRLNDDGTAKVLFNKPQRAVTPGQWVVFYDGEVCLGGAPIESVTPLKAISL